MCECARACVCLCVYVFVYYCISMKFDFAVDVASVLLPFGKCGLKAKYAFVDEPAS